MEIMVIKSGIGDQLAFGPNDNLIVWGVAFSETAGSASTAEIVLYHGTDTSGEMLLPPVNFAADGYGYPTFFPKGKFCPNGVYLERVSGETTVLIYYDRE
jgi:hypothetical protein